MLTVGEGEKKHEREKEMKYLKFLNFQLAAFIAHFCYHKLQVV